MSKIVLSYSKYHFDPKFSHSIYGTGYISSRLWDYLHEVFPDHEIVYTDYGDPGSIRGLKGVELFIGLSQNFQSFVKYLKPDIACLWSVNKSAVFRQHIRKEAKKYGTSVSQLLPEDGISANIKESLRADYVITLGGWSNYESFTEIGMHPDSVYALGIGFLDDTPMKKYQNGEHILFFVGTLSFRKGVHLIRPILEFLKNSSKNTKLIVIGRSQSKYWQAHLTKLRDDFPENFVWVQEYLEPGTRKWDNIFATVKFGIFPSFEEGAAGALAQVIHEGVPVLYSNESGIEFTQNSIHLTMQNSSDWLIQIANMLFSPAATLSSMLHEQQNLLHLNGKGLPQIKRVLTRISQGALWPGILVSPDLLTNMQAKTKNEFEVLNSAARQGKFSQLVYHGLEKLNSTNLARLGIMTLDKYPTLKNLIVSNIGDNQIVYISTLDTLEIQELDAESILLTTVNSQTTNKPYAEYMNAIYKQFFGKALNRISSLFSSFVNFFLRLDTFQKNSVTNDE